MPQAGVPLDAEQFQDVLEAAFDRDAALAREFLEELNDERGPKGLGDSTLEITIARREGKEPEYELLFDPSDSQDLKYLIEKLDVRAWEKQNAVTTPALENTPRYRTTRDHYFCSCASTRKRDRRASQQNHRHRRAQTAWRQRTARWPPSGP